MNDDRQDRIAPLILGLDFILTASTYTNAASTTENPDRNQYK